MARGKSIVINHAQNHCFALFNSRVRLIRFFCNAVNCLGAIFCGAEDNFFLLLKSETKKSKLFGGKLWGFFSWDCSMFGQTRENIFEFKRFSQTKNIPKIRWISKSWFAFVKKNDMRKSQYYDCNITTRFEFALLLIMSTTSSFVLCTCLYGHFVWILLSIQLTFICNATKWSC